MLSSFRNASQSWVMRVLLGVITIVFVVFWTAGDALNWIKTGSNQTVAHVGSERLYIKPLMDQVSRHALYHKAKTGSEANTGPLIEAVLNQQIMHKLIDIECKQLGITISNDQIKQAIITDPSFHDKDGNFSKKIYAHLLQRLGYKESEFIQETRQTILHNQFMGILSLEHINIDAIVSPFALWKNEDRAVTFKRINFADVPAKQIGEISEKDLHDHYEKNPELFSSPESRNFEVLIVNAEAIKPLIVINDEQKQKAFENFLNSKASGAPTRQETEKVLSQLKAELAAEKTYEISDSIQDDLASGSQLNEVAEKHHLPLVKINHLEKHASSLPQLTKEQLSVVLKEGFTLEEDQSAASFELKSGGFIFVQLKSIQPEALIPFKAAKDKVEQAIVHKRRQMAVKKIIEDATNEQQTAKDIALLSSGTSKIILKQDTNDGLKEINWQFKRQLFLAKPGEVIYAKDERGYVIGYVTKILNDKPSTTQSSMKALKKPMQSMIKDDLYSFLIMHLEKKYKVEINNDLIAKILRN